MCDQNVGVVGNAIPMVADFRPELHREGPAFANRIGRRTPEPQSFDGGSRVLKIDSIFEMRSRQFWLPGEQKVMIAADNHFVPIGQSSQPGIEVVCLFYRPPIEVTSVDKNVAGRQN